MSKFVITDKKTRQRTLNDECALNEQGCCLIIDGTECTFEDCPAEIKEKVED